MKAYMKAYLWNLPWLVLSVGAGVHFNADATEMLGLMLLFGLSNLIGYAEGLFRD